MVPDTGSIFATCEDPREEEQVGCVLRCISDGLAIGELSLGVVVELGELILETEAFVGVLHGLVGYLHIFFRRVDDIVLGEIADVDPALDLGVEGETTSLTLLGGDEDDPVSSACPVECGSRSILEHREVLDVGHIEAAEEAGVGYPVDDVERCRAGVHRADTTDLYRSGCTRLTTGREDLDPRRSPFESRGDIRSRLLR